MDPFGRGLQGALHLPTRVRMQGLSKNCGYGTASFELVLRTPYKGCVYEKEDQAATPARAKITSSTGGAAATTSLKRFASFVVPDSGQAT